MPLTEQDLVGLPVNTKALVKKCQEGNTDRFCLPMKNAVGQFDPKNPTVVCAKKINICRPEKAKGYKLDVKTFILYSLLCIALGFALFIVIALIIPLDWTGGIWDIIILGSFAIGISSLIWGWFAGHRISVLDRFEDDCARDPYNFMNSEDIRVDSKFFNETKGYVCANGEKVPDKNEFSESSRAFWFKILPGGL